MKIDGYQEIGAKFLASRKFALLADDPGLGKTAQAIVAADMVNAQKILVICPAVARVNWKREFYEFSIYDRDFTVCFGDADWPAPNTIVSYDYATKNVERLLCMQWDLVIIDESHFIKEPEAKRTIAIYGKSGIIRKTKGLWCLSGTPAPNHSGELWPMLYTFGATWLKYDEWIRKFCNHKDVYYGFGTQKRVKIYGTRNDSVPLLKAILSKVMLRRRKEEVLKELPKISYSDYVFEDQSLPSSVEFDFQKYKNESRAAEEAISYALNDDQSSLVLEGVAESLSTLRKINGLKKVKPYIELVTQELEDGAYGKMVVFAWHREVIEALKEGFRAYNPVVIYGGQSSTVRQNAIDSFQKDPKTKIFIGQILAAGTAITLTASHRVDILEADFVPGNNRQAIDRVHRRTQRLPVFCRFFAIVDSIDQKIQRIYRRKAQELTHIFDEGEEDGTKN